MNMIVELHILQNFAPSCLNRDDLNAPKECEFGGVRRARISSQSLKRSTRFNNEFADALTHGIGVRTKLLQEELLKYFDAKGKSREEALRVIEPVVSVLGSGVAEGRTSIALYLGIDEIARIGEAIEARYDELLAATENADEPEATGKKGKKPKKGSGSTGVAEIAKELAGKFTPGTKAADIALFGRMIADSAAMNVDAASQVAHAISTHSVPSEFDFFTAVDDLQPKDIVGAGMMGTQQFNSATFYRYANVHVPQLCANLGGDAELARQAAMAFARAFITAIPAAKQNSHAALNPPDLVLVVVREKGQALSLANAFAKPISAGREGDIVGSSAEAMAKYWDRILTAYGDAGIAAAPFFTVTPEADGVKFEKGKRVAGIDALMTSLAAALARFECKEPRA